MNTKVSQMVELLFRDVEASEEVQALHDEVLNNCQDRFEDLVKKGLSGEEALAAVMESLKGMEDVLKEYPRKRIEPAEGAPEGADQADRPQTEEPEQPGSAAFRPEDVKAIHAQLAGCDVEVSEAGGEVALEKQGRIHYALDPDGTLRIWQERISENLFRGISWEESLTSFEHFGDAVNRLVQNVSQLFSGKLGSTGDRLETRLALRLPKGFHPEVSLRTTGGDISWRDAVPGEHLSLCTTSGDIRVQLDESFLLHEAEFATTSGDAEIRLSAETVRIHSVSGDISWEGDAGMLEMNSTSGDASAAGRIRRMDLSATSGDLNLTLREDSSSEVKAGTVSGNINIRLQSASPEVTAKLNTVSGEIRTRGVDLVEEAPVCILANTVSGDLKISR